MTVQEVVRRSIETFNQHDMNAFAALYAINVVAYDPMYPEGLTGRDAILKDAEDFILAFPDIQIEVISSISGGDRAAFEMELRGTHTGPLVTPSGSIPATNRRMNLRIGRFMRVDSQGAIAADNRYYDTAGIAQQLGLS
ncbi:MAG: hypothetical protein QG637_1470 [Chloroflexota bacterium]|nr:hypothetical protein [Chloroflexota bacterium]